MSTEQEILEVLLHEAKKPSHNAATLTHNIGATFPFLETQWDDKARQIIGALVAVNASRMHTTIWAALFQQLRETDVPTIKVYILKLFANICWTVPLTQGSNAFHTFALEIRPLILDVQIVTNSAFQRHFATIIYFLKHFAEESLSLDLFNILYTNLVEWKRVDAIRATSTLIAELALSVPYCPAVETLLLRAKQEMDLFGYVILFETLVTESSDNCRRDRECFRFFCEEMDDALRIVLQSITHNRRAIPSCVSAYRRLRAIDGAWESKHAATLSSAILQYLEQESTNRLLICPFLQFLQTTSHNWWCSSNTIWKFAECIDPFVRANAFLALSSKCHALNALERKLTITELMEELHNFIEQNCSYTTVAILKFLNALVISSHIPSSTQEMYLAKLLHICCRFGKEFRHDTAAQLELLNFFAAASFVPEAAQQFTLKLFLESNDRTVAAKAFRTLICISASCTFDEDTVTLYNFENIDNFFEGLVYSEEQKSGVYSSSFANCIPRCEILSTVIHQRLLGAQFNEPNEGLSYIVASDAMKLLCELVDIRKWSVSASLHSTLTILTQGLISQSAMSSDVYIAVIQALSAYVSRAGPEACTNINLLAPLVQHSWSVLGDCTAAIYPHFSPAATASSSRFFRSDATPFLLHGLIIKCKDVALSNEVPLYTSIFYEIIENNICFLKNCITALLHSPLFVNEFFGGLQQILRCCDTLFYCTQKHTFSFLVAILDALVSLEFTSEIDAHYVKQLVFQFSNCCSSLVHRPITLDFVSYCPAMCNFLLFCLQQDGGENSGIFAELMANNWSVFADLLFFCKCDFVCYGTADEEGVVSSVLRLIRSLCWSSYFMQITHVISFDDVSSVAHHFQKWKWLAEKAERCQMISDIQRAYEKNRSSTTDDLTQSICKYDSERNFFNFFESVVALFNVSDAENQERVKEILVSQHTGASLVCLSAIDNPCISYAVKYVLETSVDECILETLLFIISESESLDILPLEFYITDAVFGTADELIVKIVLSYRWGWLVGPRTVKMLSSDVLKNQKSHLGLLVKQLSQLSMHDKSFEENHKLLANMSDNEDFSVQDQLFPGISAIELLVFTSNDRCLLNCSAIEVLLSDSPSALQVLHRFFVARGDFEGLSDPRVIFLFARYISVARPGDMLLWELLEWASLLRSWVSVTLRMQAEGKYWGSLLLSCWILFYRLYSHLCSVAKSGHPRYPKEQSAYFLKDLRIIYLQLSNCFLCCSAKSVDGVAVFAVRYALKNSSVVESGGVYEYIFWCIARMCLDSVWAVLSSEQWASVYDPEVVKFLCRANGRIGLRLHIQRKAYTIFSVMLEKFGAADAVYDPDAQRHALWLISSFGQRLYSLTATKDRLTTNSTQGHSKMDFNERQANAASFTYQSGVLAYGKVEDLLVFRSAVARAVFKLAEAALGMFAQVPPSTVYDALDILRDISYLTTSSSVSVPLEGTSSEVENIYFLVRDFLAAVSPLSANASLEPTTHCLYNLMGKFVKPRRASVFSDEYALSLSTAILSGTLASWLRRSTSLSAPPAQIPCTLAVYLPYLMRLDLPLYTSALVCLELIAAYSSNAEVEAVNKVVLQRLPEDLVDIQWNSPIAAGWDKALLALFGLLASSMQTEKEWHSCRLWEGMWRCAGAPDVCQNQNVRESAQQALRQLIRNLTPKSPQWEASRLVLLSTSIQRGASGVSMAAQCGPRASDKQLPFHIVADMENSWWRTLLAETQAEFLLCAANVLDADSSRSLLFEFVMAVDSLLDSVTCGAVRMEEVQKCFLLRERVSSALLSSTEATMAALNSFTFSSLDRRLAVLHGLCGVVANESQSRPAAVMSATWTGVYFDSLFERATCVDEGLWVVCALAAVEAGGSRLKWVIPALQSLVPASSTRWKRSFLRSVGQLAKREETQGQVRDFFTGARNRLAPSHVPSAVWKDGLLAEVILVFTP
ncbi:hypothetical protein ABL78_7912 [Leptomonas seymouri]|uniref:Uncharacterized protein n=1 Tax=Leptomonas seymouri TaxID=5684 RepID=A0A0N1HTC3_LEPSE|nr:hypothetical protein ABL78_7912 [Leptomonas seymouri]|eukprot:KPI83061.1 hypothetical protein ABL78_7912 [Leptomonas seymouri]